MKTTLEKQLEDISYWLNTGDGSKRCNDNIFQAILDMLTDLTSEIKAAERACADRLGDRA